MSRLPRSLRWLLIADPTRVIFPKSNADQGKYVHPELYGKPRSAGIGYRKPPRAPHKPVVKR